LHVSDEIEPGIRPPGPLQRRHAIAAWLVLALAVPLLIITSNGLLDLAPVQVALAVDGQNMTLAVDGRVQQAYLPAAVQTLRFPAVAPHQREYQIDGSDTTNNFTFDPSYFAVEASAPYYRLQAWLRDDSSYSRWQDLVVRNGEGSVVTEQAQPAGDVSIVLPRPFRLTVNLHRLETPRTLELVDSMHGVVRVVIDRNDRYVSIASVSVDGLAQQLAMRYFPFSWQPALVDVVYLLLRAGAMACALAVALTLVAAAAPAWRPPVRLPGDRVTAMAAAGAVLVASAYGAVALFASAPHILDAVSYYFQAKIFAGGHFAAPAPPLPDAFPTPFFVDVRGKWFSQYPPGTSLLLAAGFKLGLPWLVEPLLAAGAALLVFGAARRQFGRATAAVVAALFATSPFLLLQAGAFLSDVPAMASVTLALYAVTRYLEHPERRWVALAAGGIGFAFLCREIAAVLYGLPLFVFILVQARRRGQADLFRDVTLAAACLAAFLLLYLLYNTIQTGAPLLLPRNLFNPADQYGFGAGIGFYGRHTLGAGLVNTDELLTSLTITLFGWPFSVAPAVLLAPFLLRRPQPWELLHGAVVALFVLAFVGYFYHGIAFGPRYYLEALPSMVILAARGYAALAQRAEAILVKMGRRGAQERARVATLVLLTGLLACNLIYFLPRQVALYRGYQGLPGAGGPALGGFVRQETVGRVATLRNALVTTDDWWTYNVYLAALNCPSLDCPTVFAYAPDALTLQALQAAFPGRTWYQIDDSTGTLEAAPG